MNKEQARNKLETLNCAYIMKSSRIDALTRENIEVMDEMKRLQAIIDAPEIELKKLDWSKMPEGTLVEVFNENNAWSLRYFAREQMGRLEVYPSGCTKLTAGTATACFQKVGLTENPEFTYCTEDPLLPEGLEVELKIVVWQDGKTKIVSCLCASHSPVFFHAFRRTYQAVIAYRIIGVAEGWSANRVMRSKQEKNK